MLDEEQIKQMGYKKLGENLYELGNTLFCQYQGSLVPVKNLDEATLRDITDYEVMKKRLDNLGEQQEKKEKKQQKAEEPEVKEPQAVQQEEPQNVGATAIKPAEEPQGGGVIQLAADLDRLEELYDQYDQLKERLLKDSDTQKISGNLYTKKSGWRKIATAFNISDELISQDRQPLDDGEVRYQVTVRASAPNGRTSIGVGMCSSLESGKSLNKKNNKEHDILGTAHTRAKNRAISDLLGGEVSYEEMKQ